MIFFRVWDNKSVILLVWIISYRPLCFFMLRNLFTLNLNERVVAYSFLILLLSYIIFYGLFVSKGFDFSFNILYLTVLIPIFLIDNIRTLIESLFRGQFHIGFEDLKKVTVVIPTCNGWPVLEPTIMSLLKRFPPENIIVAANGSRDDSYKKAAEFGVRLYEIEKPVGKVNAINYALEEVKTPYTLIMDDDTLINNAIVPTSALEEGYEAVAFRVLPIIENYITQIQDHEYRKSMDLGKTFQNKYSTVQTISGAIGLFRTKELKRQINLHSGEFSGEDLQRTLLIHLTGTTKGVVVTNATVMTAVPNTFLALFFQRISGWNPGFYSNIKYYISLLFSPKTKWPLRFDAFYVLVFIIGLDFFRLVSLPVIIFYPWFFVIFYIAYVLSESLPYLKMGRKGPYWVILIFPLYGLFNFIARVTSLPIFFYRRLTVMIARKKHLDDYRFVGTKAKIFSISITNFFVGGILSIRLLTLDHSAYNNMYKFTDFFVRQQQEILVSPLPQTLIPSPTPTPSLVSVNTIRSDYEFKAQAGESKWSLARKAVNAYVSDNDLHLSGNKINTAIYNLTVNKNDLTIHEGNLYAFSSHEIKGVITN